MAELGGRYMWGKTGRRLYPYLDSLEATGLEKTLAVVGCSDGAEVIPAANRGFDVTAIDMDTTALYGGNVMISGQDVAVKGLRHWTTVDGVRDKVDILEGDFMELNIGRTFTGVMTSGLLHYKENSVYRVEDMIEKIKSLVSIGGILLIEYIHVGESKNNDPSRHFLTRSEIEKYFRNGWRIRSNQVRDRTEDPNPRSSNVHTTAWGRLYASRLGADV